MCDMTFERISDTEYRYKISLSKEEADYLNSADTQEELERRKRQLSYRIERDVINRYFDNLFAQAKWVPALNAPTAPYFRKGQRPPIFPPHPNYPDKR